MERIKELTWGETVVFVRRGQTKSVRIKEKKIVVRKPQKSIHHRKTFRSHELIACQKASLPCSVCLCVSVKLYFSNLCEKPEVYIQNNWDSLLFLCHCINHADTANVFTRSTHSYSMKLLSPNYDWNSWQSAQEKAFLWLLLDESVWSPLWTLTLKES